MRNHGACSHCGRRYRSARARIIAERYAAVVADLRGIRPAEHLRPVDYDVTPKDRDEAQARAARVRQYKQTGDLQDAA